MLQQRRALGALFATICLLLGESTTTNGASNNDDPDADGSRTTNDYGVDIVSLFAADLHYDVHNIYDS